MTLIQNNPPEIPSYGKLGKLTLASYPDIVELLADIYTAVARANASLGVLSQEKAAALSRAAKDLVKEAPLGATPIYGILGHPFYRNFALLLAQKATTPALTVTCSDVERNCASADITATLLNAAAYRMVKKNASCARQVASALREKAGEFGTRLNVRAIHFKTDSRFSWQMTSSHAHTVLNELLNVLKTLWILLPSPYSEPAMTQRVWVQIPVSLKPFVLNSVT